MPDIGGVYSASATSTLSFSEWWLKNPLDPTYNLVLSVAGVFKLTKKEEQSVYEPLGRPMPVVVRGVMRGERFPMTVDFLTIAEWQKFEALRNQQVTLLLQRGYSNEEWYGVIGAQREITEHISDHTYKTITFEFIETGSPT